MTLGWFEIMLIASTLLEFNPLLQAIRIIKSKKSTDVSAATYVMILTIGTMWLVYGIKTNSLPLIIGNTIKLFTSLCVIIVYYLYGKKTQKVG